MRIMIATVVIFTLVATMAIQPVKADTKPIGMSDAEIRKSVSLDGFTASQEETVIVACRIAILGIPNLGDALTDPAYKVTIGHSADLTKTAKSFESDGANLVQSLKKAEEGVNIAPTAMTFGIIEPKRIVFKIFLRDDMLKTQYYPMTLDLIVHELGHVNYKRNQLIEQKQGKKVVHSIAAEEAAVYATGNKVFMDFFTRADPTIRKNLPDYDNFKQKLQWVYDQNDKLLTSWQEIAAKESGSTSPP